MVKYLEKGSFRRIYFSEYSRRQKLEKWLLTSTVGRMIDILSILLTLLSCALYIYETTLEKDPQTNERDVPTWLSTTDYVVACAFSAELLLFFYLAESKRRYLISVWVLIDLITIIPMFAQEILKGLGFTRILRIIRLLKFLKSYLFKSLGAINQQIMVLLMTTTCLIFAASGLILYIEEDDNPLIVNYFDAVWFIMVTFTTVGYGDISPDTTWGRIFIIFFMIGALAVITYQSSELADLLGTSTKYDKNYRLKNIEHILITGEFNASLIADLTNEIYHEDRLHNPLQTVLVSDSLPDDALKNFLAERLLQKRVTYLRANVFVDKELDRARATHANAIFVVSNQFAENPELEDKKTILKILAIKEYCRDVQILAQVQLVRSAEYLIHAGVEHVFATNTLKMGILAKTIQFPGFSTFISNLVRSSSAVDEKSIPNANRDLREYLHGTNFEMYSFKLATFDGFLDLPFEEAAFIIYAEFGCCLFGIYSDKKQKTLLNPANTVLAENDIAFILAPDEKIIGQIMKYEDHSKEREKRSKEFKGGDSSEGIKLRKLALTVPKKSSRSRDVKRKSQREGSQNSLKNSSLRELPDRPVPRDLKDHIIVCAFNWLDFSKILDTFRQNASSGSKSKTQTKTKVTTTKPKEGTTKTTTTTTTVTTTRRKSGSGKSGKVGCVPVVIICSEPESAIDWKYARSALLDYEDVYHVAGNPSRADILKEARIKRADKIMILSKSFLEETELNNNFVDSDVVLTYFAVKALTDAYCVVEIARDNTMKFLEERKPNSKGELVKDFNLLSIFMSGRIYTASLLNTLLCQAYFNPHVLDIVKALVFQKDEQNGKFATLPIPKQFVGEAYLKVFSHLIKHGILCLGLYRTSTQKNSNNSFVYTNPEASTTVNETDMLYIVAQGQEEEEEAEEEEEEEEEEEDEEEDEEEEEEEEEEEDEEHEEEEDSSQERS